MQYVLAAQEEEEARRLENIASKWSFYAEDYQQQKSSSSSYVVAVAGINKNKAEVFNDQLTEEAQKVCVRVQRIVFGKLVVCVCVQWWYKVDAMRSKVNTIRRQRDNHLPNEVRVFCEVIDHAHHNLSQSRPKSWLP